MTEKLFLRDYRLTIATHDVTGVDIKFKVEKTLKPTPNTCAIQVFNLNESTRKDLETLKKIPVRLEAGYKSPGTMSQLFFGEVRTAYSRFEQSDVLTILETGDKEKEIRGARLQVSFGPKTPADTALRAVAQALKVGTGNLDRAIGLLRAKGVTSLYPRSVSLSGSAAAALTDICKSAGLEWSVQDGNLQIVDLNKPLEGKAVDLSSDTGLVESPTLDSKGVLEATCLMIPGLTPGAKVSMNSRSFKGGFRIQKVTYVGDTAGQEWYAKIEAKRY